MKLEEIEKLCAEATPGPEGPIVNSEKQALRDAKFLAASHNLVPKLLAVAKAAKTVFEENLEAVGLVSLGKALEELEKE